MAWQTPKTNWTTSSIVNPNDMNRIEGNIEHLKGEVDLKASESYVDEKTQDVIEYVDEKTQDFTNYVDEKTQDVVDYVDGKTQDVINYVDGRIQNVIDYVDDKIGEGGGGGGDAEAIRKDSSLPLVVEVRTDDPENPVVGQIWLRADLVEGD